MLFICMVLVEAFEFFWQKGESIREYMQNLFNIYQKGVIYFASLHASFIFILFCIFGLNLTSFYAYLIASIKFFDIAFKIHLLNRIDKGLPLGGYEEIITQDAKLSNMSKLISSSTYLFLFYLALQDSVGF